MFGRRRLQYKTPEQILVMRRAGLVVADALRAVRDALAPGVTTAELDAVAEDVIRGGGATPSFKGYHGFTGSICASINEQVVHGIPGSLALAEGDLVSIDCGAIVDGWHGDAAFSCVLGSAADSDLALIDATESAMWSGIAAAATGEHLDDIGTAVERDVAGRYGILEDYTGHGIGTEMHMAPDVPNYRTGERGPALRPGLCLAIEPMLTIGEAEVRELDDGWTVVTASGQRAAHYEHTVALTESGPWVLTAHDGGRQELASHGVTISTLAD